MKHPARIAVPSLLVSLAGGSFAQQALSGSRGDGDELMHGFSLAAAGDMDGDGREDYWMGAPAIWTCEAAAVYLVSGRNGATLRRIEAESTACMGPGPLFGFSLAAGEDLSGDGVADVLIGVPSGQGLSASAGRVEARSGSDGSLLFVVPGRVEGDRFGEALAFVDDFDGDGVTDFLVGAPGDDVGGTDRGSVRAVSGASGAGLGTQRGSAAGDEFGRALAPAGDVDLDGHPDFLVGAPGAELAGADTGRAVLISGGTGAELAVHEGNAAGDLFGHALASAGDVNGDGRLDQIVGAPGGKYARVVSGADGAELWSVAQTLYDPFPILEYPDGFGAAVVGIGDQDGDGFDDVAIGRPRHSTLWVYSGIDGTMLRRFEGGSSARFGGEDGSYLGFALARLADQDGDGAPEIVAGAPALLNESFDLGGGTAVLSCRVGPQWFFDSSQSVYRVMAPGDVDDDGCDDLAYSAGGEVTILSGRDLSTLRTLDWADALMHAGDVDADGRDDLIVSGVLDGVPGTYVLSGATGDVLHAFPELGGDAVGDLNGDGHADVACPRFALGEPGRVAVYSGSDGNVLLELVGEQADCGFCNPCFDESFGGTADVGDWNLDGVPDVAVAAPSGGPFHTGEVRVFSGVDGSQLQDFAGEYYCNNGFAISIDGAPDFDVDADGWVDLLVGEQQLPYGPHPGFGIARVYSSRTGEVVAGWYADTEVGYTSGAGPAYSVAVAGDFNGDGHSDFVVGNPTRTGFLGSGVGEAVVVSGRDSSVLATITGTSSWDYLGYQVTGLGDTNCDGLSDVFVRRPGNEGSSGAVLLLGRKRTAHEHSAPDRTVDVTR